MKKIEKDNLYKLNTKAFDAIVKNAGSIKALHRKCQKVSNCSENILRYSRATKQMSPYVAYIIEKATEGAVGRSELLPTLFKMD